MFDEVVELLDPDMKPTGSELEVNQTYNCMEMYICVKISQMASPPDSPLILPERNSPGIVDDTKVRLSSFHLSLPTSIPVGEIFW